MSFVAFFPTLLAGPITLYSEMGPQLGIRPQRKGVAQNLLIGLIIFSLGSSRKQFSRILLVYGSTRSSRLFTKAAPRDSSSGGARPSLIHCRSTLIFPVIATWRSVWRACLGFVLPLNFFSPLRSTSISELWRRWHMTLSRFVRVYIHQPLSIPLARFAARRATANGRR